MSNLSFLRVFRCWTVQLFQFLHLHWPGISSMIPASQTWMLPHIAGYTKLESKKTTLQRSKPHPSDVPKWIVHPFDFLEAPVDLWSDFDSKYEKTCLSKVKSSEVIRWGILDGKTGNKKIFCISSEGFWKAEDFACWKYLKCPEVPQGDPKRDRWKKNILKRFFWCILPRPPGA